MSVPLHRDIPWVIHPLHAVLLASLFPLALGAVFADLAYARSYHVQWTNFASWLVLGVNLFAGAVLVFAVVGLTRLRRRGTSAWIYVGLAATVFVLGVFNSLVHAKDAWAAMPAALVLSIITFLLVVAAIWLGFAGYRTGDRT